MKNLFPEYPTQLLFKRVGHKNYALTILIMFLLIFQMTLPAQNIIEGKLIFKTLSSDSRPNDTRMVKSEALFGLFQQYGVTKYEQAIPSAKTPSLHYVYKIEFTGNHQQFKSELEHSYSNMITGILGVTKFVVIN
jgi:hypothetical protein